MPINARQKPIYESFKMLHPDGTFMCHINEKRANWYVEKNLAFWVDEKTFQLKFEPKGNGKKELSFYTQKLENRCVVCGETSDNLNKHHVVPYVFRSRFPREYKESNHHDILVTCVNCHEHYEGIAMQYKKDLAQELGISMSIKMSEEQKYNKKIISARNVLLKIKNKELVNEKGEILIPLEKLKELDNLASLDLKDEPQTDTGPVWADKIVEEVLKEDKLFEFVKKWRVHFLINTNPQYLPEHWSVDHPLEKSNK